VGESDDRRILAVLAEVLPEQYLRNRRRPEKRGTAASVQRSLPGFPPNAVNGAVTDYDAQRGRRLVVAKLLCAR